MGDLQSGSGVPPLSSFPNQSRDGSATLDPLRGYFDPATPVAFLTGDLPHWRQKGVTYFVTFRLADSLPQEKLVQWRSELSAWHRSHPEPHDEATRREFYDLFPARLQAWLDAGYGSCVLRIPETRKLVETALQHFHGTRYSLEDFVVAKNHVHALVTPLQDFELSRILHSWKSFTAHKMLKLDSCRPLRGASVWQKESFDHIVRSPASREKFRAYISAH